MAAPGTARHWCLVWTRPYPGQSWKSASSLALHIPAWLERSMGPSNFSEKPKRMSLCQTIYFMQKWCDKIRVLTESGNINALHQWQLFCPSHPLAVSLASQIIRSTQWWRHAFCSGGWCGIVSICIIDLKQKITKKHKVKRQFVPDYAWGIINDFGLIDQTFVVLGQTVDPDAQILEQEMIFLRVKADPDPRLARPQHVLPWHFCQTFYWYREVYNAPWAQKIFLLLPSINMDVNASCEAINDQLDFDADFLWVLLDQIESRGPKAKRTDEASFTKIDDPVYLRISLIVLAMLDAFLINLVLGGLQTMAAKTSKLKHLNCKLSINFFNIKT